MSQHKALQQAPAALIPRALDMLKKLEYQYSVDDDAWYCPGCDASQRRTGHPHERTCELGLLILDLQQHIQEVGQ